MKILITGASGYVGSNLFQALAHTNYSINLLFRYKTINSLTSLHNMTCHYYDDLDDLIKIFDKVKPELVIHTAGYIVNNYENIDIKHLIDANVYYGLEILEAMRKSGCKNFIYIGSFYQNKKPSLFYNYNLYAATKNAFEEIIDYYVDTHDFKVLKMRFPNIYGPNNNRSILNKLVNHVGNTSEFVFYTSDKILNFIHINEVTKSIISNVDMLIKAESNYYKTIFVKSRKFILLSDLIRFVEEVSGSSINHNLKSNLKLTLKSRVFYLLSDHVSLKKDIYKLLNHVD
jgi:CDP-3, 6-dideoxy-D-glycero-L-glycero-4-hexulose-4-reductase